MVVAGEQLTERRKLLPYRVHKGLRPDSEQKRYQSDAQSYDTTSASQRMKRADALHSEYARLNAA